MNIQWMKVGEGREAGVGIQELLMSFSNAWLAAFCQLHLPVSVPSISCPLSGEIPQLLRHLKARDWHGLQLLQISSFSVFFMTVQSLAVASPGCLRGSGGMAYL